AAVRLVGIRAGAARRVAGAGDVALVARGADDRIRAGADPGLARVGLRAGVTVAAGAAVRLVGVRAGAARRIARAGYVALVARGAADGILAGADPGLARVRLRPALPASELAAVRLVGIRAGAARRIARAGDVTLIARRTDYWVGARTHASLAGVGL